MHSAEEFLKNKSIEINKFRDNNEDYYSEIENFEKLKSKVLKYALYKKRSEFEIRQKFSKDIEENTLNDIIEILKQNSYIDDYNYIEKTINEFVKLKNLSIKEIKYKLISKGINNNLIEDFLLDNYEEMQEYERTSAINLVNKKRYLMDEDELKAYLIKKGYSNDNIKDAFLS